MAYDEGYGDDENFDYGSLSIEHQREFTYELLGWEPGGLRQPLDNDVRETFYDVMYNDDLSYGQRMEAYEDLKEILWDEYGIDFEEIWDWEAFREWYG